MPATVLVAHLPGKHDQSSHGRGGGTVRPSLAEATTSEQVGVAAAAEAKAITGRDIAFDMAGSDPQIAREHAEGVLQGLERFPDAPLGSVGTYGPGASPTSPQRRASSFAVTDPANNSIYFNNRYAGNPPAYRDAVNKSRNEFSVATDPRGVALHEFGHVMTHGRTEDAVLDHVEGEAEKLFTVSSVLAASRISSRASENKAEMAAEVFADVMINGSDASQVSLSAFPIAVGSPPLTAAVLVAADPGQPYVSPDDLNSIIPLWQTAVAEHVTPVVAEVFRDTADQLHAQLVNVTDLPQLPSVSSLAAETYLAQAVNTFEQVGDELWETARTQLLEGFQKGESIPELATRLRASAGLSAKTAVLVARTQVLDASNAASIATARVSGIPMRKGWLDTPDARTRESHLLAGSTYGADEQMIDLDAQFMVGGYSCDRPHDPVLPPSERFNCRCSLAYSVSDDDVAEARDLWTPEPPIPNTTPIPSSQLPGDTPTVAEARNVADLLAEAEELIGNEVDSPILAARLRALAARQNIPAHVSQGLVDAAGDVAGLRKALRKVAKDADIIPIGQAGHIVLFDAAIHRSAETVRAGEAVEIFRPGAWYDGRGGRVLLFKALVETPGRTPRGIFGAHTSGQAGIAAMMGG